MATIHDVAQEARVSSTTVSRYLNRRIELPLTTSLRIDAAIAKLNYRPNIIAKRLSTGRTESIGLVAPNIREPFFAELADAVEDEADRHGYTISMSSTRNDREREIASLNRLHDHHVDGLIMVTNTLDDGTLAGLIAKQDNVVLVGEDIPDVAAPRIFVENERGAYEATRHLIEAGHKDIAYIGGPQGLLSVEERLAGYLRAMRDAGLPIREELVRLGSFTQEFGRQAIGELLVSRDPPTAIFTSCECLTIGAMMGLRQNAVSIPDEMSIVAFDDIPMTELMQPALTAVRRPFDDLGRHSFLALFALLTGAEPPMLTRLPVELIRRASVAPPRQRDLR
jgi:LacI family transcriptional regulator